MNCAVPLNRFPSSRYRRTRRWVSLLLGSLGLSLGGSMPLSQAQTSGFCHLPTQVLLEKETLLRAASRGDRGAQERYQALVRQHAQQLAQCRARTWPQTQAIWLRLYECDLNPGVLDNIMDRIVSRGYNQVYVEVFYNGQVLLPPNDNPTVWQPVVRRPEFAQRDLLAEAIQKGRERGLKVYAWTFAMNFGYSYGQRPDRQMALARNGRGQTSANVVDTSRTDIDIAKGDVDRVFIDPYSPQARQDFTQMLQKVLQRRPDGVLFDYIRYPRQTGGASVATRPTDFWIYGNAARQTLIARAQNQKGRAIIERFLSQGSVSTSDLAAVDRQFANEGEPMWQGRQVASPNPSPLPPASARINRLQNDLWLLSAAHAYQGIVDFLVAGATQVQRQGIPSGAVFFPDANRRIGQGFDSRMQPWDRFPRTIEWHPMSYALCGNTSCIVDQVREVLAKASGVRMSPVLAGDWGGFAYDRPSLEAQMNAIRQATPQINSVSHFDFSWQEPQFSNSRRSCRVNFAESR